MVPRSALVTGGSGGIGLEVAAKLAERGHSLTIAGRSVAKLEAARAAVSAATGAAIAIHVADAGDLDATAALVAAHVRRTGGIDVLCVAAGTGSPDHLDDADPGQMQRILQTNLQGAVALIGAALPHLRAAAVERGTAHVVLVASLAGVRPTPGYAIYSASKAAVCSLARSLNIDHGSAGIRATAVCPGYVDTAMTTWVRETVDRATMLRPADVAAVVDLLLDLSPVAVVDEIVLRRSGAVYGEP